MEETEKQEEIKNNENKNEEKPEISPLEEAKIFLEENKKILSQITEERKKMEKILANISISGKGYIFQNINKKEETAEEYSERIRRGEI
jgi:hypothetical protein